MPESVTRRNMLALPALAPLTSALSAAPSEKVWEGIFVIMQTPFLETLELDEECLRKETDFLARSRVHGMVWPAGAGETVSLSFKERMQYSQAVVQENRGRCTVLIGVHGVTKFEAMDYARHAEKIGADGIHALGPSNGTTDTEIMTDYFMSIASVSKLPMCIQESNGAMTTDFLLKLAEKIPTLKILKLENGNVPQEVTRVVKERKRALIPSTGGGALYLMNEMERGSGGTMAGAGLADIQTEVWDLYHAGKKAEAESLFLKFALAGLLERRSGYVLQKEILRRRGIFKNVVMRNTRKFTLDEGDLKELDHIMEILKPHFRV
jgi:dihydrodipicolinate synthase/N-acetylneuraminate lyase